MLRRSLVLLAVLAVVGAVLVGCGGDGHETDRASTRLLLGSEWALDQRESRLGAVSRSAVVTADFSADGRLTGNAGCNTYGADFAVDGDELTVLGVVSTTMACEPRIMRMERAYLERLPKATSFTVDGDLLTVETTGAGPLVYDALDPEELFAGDWVVTGYFRPGAITSTINGTTLTATFDAGRISGDSGCNRYSGPYELEGNDITIGPLASTQRACVDLAVGQQETEYLAALEMARSYRFDAGTLTLVRADGGIAVTFRRA